MRLPYFIQGLLLLAVSIGSGAIRAQTPTDADLVRLADERVQFFVKQNKFTGTVLIARDGKPIFRKAYGMADREWDIDNTLDTKFRLGSITKQFTATLILRLVEQGKVKLDDPVSKYYTDAPKTWSKITIHHLLTHTSGIPSYTAIPDFFPKHSRDPLTPAGIMKLTQDAPLDFEPGTKFSYDNSGYILLGYIIEKVTGKSYAANLQENIFGPLGMKDSGYDDFAQVIHHRASGYERHEGNVLNAPYLDMSLPYAAGSLYSTVDDLLIWDQALYGDKILSEESKRKMFTPFLDNYAYGWLIRKDPKHLQFSHGGGINGFNTEIERYPQDKVTVIALSNLGTDAMDNMGGDLALLAFGEKIPEPAQHNVVTLDPKLLAPLVGRYELSPSFAIEITREGDHLFAQATNQPKFPLFAESETKFFFKVVDAQLEFERNGTGAATSVTLHQNGASVKGMRK